MIYSGFMGSHDEIHKALEAIAEVGIDGAVRVTVSRDPKDHPKQRSPQQRKALEVYCDMLATSLNNAGYSFNDNTIIRLPVQFTQENVKETIFKGAMRGLYPDKDSTTELSTTEIQSVYENLNLYTAEHWAISVPWPDKRGA